MSDSEKPMTIMISKDGPYLISGGIPLSLETIGTNAQGESWEWEPGKTFEVKDRYALCRCGESSTKPYCDGTHKAIGFDGTETATRASYADQAETIEGPVLSLDDAQALCAFARFCDGHGSVWSLVEKTNEAEAKTLTIHEATRCPSGRLVLHENASGKAIEPALEKSIAITEDPEQKCSGPLWVKGGILVESQDGGRYEVRNRVTLCRCGASSNKPFCDGSHASALFQDGL
jgi:CDGSH-type Zn-finger protein